MIPHDRISWFNERTSCEASFERRPQVPPHPDVCGDFRRSAALAGRFPQSAGSAAETSTRSSLCCSERVPPFRRILTGVAQFHISPGFDSSIFPNRDCKEDSCGLGRRESTRSLSPPATPLCCERSTPIWLG